MSYYRFFSRHARFASKQQAASRGVYSEWYKLDLKLFTLETLVFTH